MSELRAVDRLIQRRRFVVAAHAVPEGAEILDIGCSDGAWFEHLGGRIAPSTGVDPELAESVVTPSGHALVRGTVKDLPKAATFDCFTALAVLEHFETSTLLELGHDLRSRARPGSVLVATIPSPAVDRLLDVGIRLHFLAGMEAVQHHGEAVEAIIATLELSGWAVRKHRRFELGLNHLFVLS